MTEYERGKRAGLRQAVKLARYWHSDERLDLTFKRNAGEGSGIRHPQNQDPYGRAQERELRRHLSGQELAARGIAQDIEKLLSRNME